MTIPTLTASVYQTVARLDHAGIILTRIGLIVVLIWIGGLKAARYEAEGIMPFVANSPFMSFFYGDPGGYKTHMNPEGSVVQENIEWNVKNHTYIFSYGLGALIVLFGLMLCTHLWLPRVAALGGFMVFLMSFVTLSFLVTTPECWVPPLGDPDHGFPFLALPGLLVVKDSIMMGASLAVAADSAKAWLRTQVVSNKSEVKR